MKTINYLTRRLHGIKWDVDSSDPWKKITWQALRAQLRMMIGEDDDLFAKGAALEITLLSGFVRARISDLADIGCPKYDDLPLLEDSTSLDERHTACHFHIFSHMHCPLNEVLAFRQWFLNNPCVTCIEEVIE
jgi:hypothetical protein